jgi:hypothetical protein
MIGKVSNGKNFRGCINYVFEGQLQKNTVLQQQEAANKQAQVICYNQCFGDRKELIKQFNEVRYLNPKQSRPVLHASLSFAHGDQLSNQDKVDIAQKLAKDLGFSGNQYLVVEHHDKKHQHLHVVANRVGFEGKTVSDSNNYQRMANFCRKMEIEYKLEKVLSPRKFQTPAQRQLPRLDMRKENLKQVIRHALQHSKSMNAFQGLVQQKGYAVELGRGIAFTDAQQVRFKGSEVGYPMQQIEQQIQQNLRLQQQQQAHQKEQQNAQLLQQQREQERELEQKNEHKQSQGMHL